MTHHLRRKRLKHQCKYRGTKELDIILGKFADIHLDTLSDTQLDVFEELLNIGEATLLSWLLGYALPDPKYAGLITLIKQPG